MDPYFWFVGKIEEEKRRRAEAKAFKAKYDKWPWYGKFAWHFFQLSLYLCLGFCIYMFIR